MKSPVELHEEIDEALDELAQKYSGQPSIFETAALAFFKDWRAANPEASPLITKDTQKAKIAERRKLLKQQQNDKIAAEGAAQTAKGVEGIATADAKANGDWKAGLVRNDKGVPIWNHANAALYLRHDPAFKGCLAYDEFAAQAVLRKPLPGSHARKTAFRTRPLQDGDAALALMWFQKNGFPRASLEPVYAAMQDAASRAPYHPVEDYLDALEWDGTPRLHRWVCDYLGVDPSDHLARGFGKRFLIAMVARVREPGCQSDSMIVLEGAQGRLKSSALRALVPDPDYFSDDIPDLRSKDAKAHLRGKWLVEMPELAASAGVPAERVKQFLALREDRFRPAYGRSEIAVPRQVAFAGTTNATNWHEDPTGGRRFWPIKIGRLDTVGLRKVRDQLWAEADVLHSEGRPWWLPSTLSKPQDVAIMSRLWADPWEAPVRAWLAGYQISDAHNPEGPAHKGQPLTEIAAGALLKSPIGLKYENMKTGDYKRMAMVLRRLGWIRDGKFTSGPYKDDTRFVPGPDAE